MRFRSQARNPNFRNPHIRNFRVRKSCVPTTRVRNTGVGDRGFTLIEMVVVISMILILLSIALPMYNQSIIHAREAKLRQNLATLNEVIEKYSLDKGHAPLSPDDLVQAGYIKRSE